MYRSKKIKSFRLDGIKGIKLEVAKKKRKNTQHELIVAALSGRHNGHKMIKFPL